MFPLHGTICSSELCLEWETALAADHPQGGWALGFFSHGAADLEDTTIERHAVRVGRHVAREWLYPGTARPR